MIGGGGGRRGDRGRSRGQAESNVAIGRVLPGSPSLLLAGGDGRGVNAKPSSASGGRRSVIVRTSGSVGGGGGGVIVVMLLVLVLVLMLMLVMWRIKGLGRRVERESCGGGRRRDHVRRIGSAVVVGGVVVVVVIRIVVGVWQWV